MNPLAARPASIKQVLDLPSPQVMGILNLTPDSFSDGGRYFRNVDLALREALRMVDDGAAIIDIGGESTRPGAEPVSLQEELDRVIPVIEKIRKESPVSLSIDTSKAGVMTEAARAGASLINDVCALRAEGALAAAAASTLPVCLMHMQGKPQTMQQQPAYTDVLAEVKQFLQQRIVACEAAGIARESILIDPGVGFGKTLEHNLTLIKKLGTLSDLGCPILVGVSRKSMIARLSGREDGDRLAGSLTLALACVGQGAKIVRAHDVRETVDALRIHCAIQAAR